MTRNEFAALHTSAEPLVLFNIWDAGSARAVADAGARVIATGSYAVAGAQGHADGEGMPFEALLATVRQIAGAVSVPLTVDIETGFAEGPEALAQNAQAVREAGAIGCNIEDRLLEGEGLRSIAEQVERIAAVAGSGLFVNARTDVFLGSAPAALTSQMIDGVITRAEAYAKAGAGSLFVPFLSDHPTIAAICERSPLPVNIMWGTGSGTHGELAALGVARISYGPGPWLAAMEWLGEQAREVFGG